MRPSDVLTESEVTTVTFLDGLSLLGPAARAAAVIIP